MKDQFTKTWIIENSLEVINDYADGVLTIRGLHYQLVGRGMTNTMRHYKRVVNAMISARREGDVRFETFSDRDRGMDGETSWETISLDKKVSDTEYSIDYWMKNYRLNKWSNQNYYPEIWIEKKALIGTFERPCLRHNVALAACKGYPSLTFLFEGAQRFKKAEAEGKIPVLIYFGDYDPSGEDIPRSIEDNMRRDFGLELQVKRMALMEEQVVAWKLPPAPAKSGDSRTSSWDGLGQVELDAVSPDKIVSLVDEAIEDIFDQERYDELKEREAEEKIEYQSRLKTFVNNLDTSED